MSTKKELVAFRTDTEKLDFLCKLTGFNRSQVINSLIDAEYISCQDSKKQEIFSQMKDLQNQMLKLQESLKD